MISSEMKVTTGYYQKNKEARQRDQHFSAEEKNKKQKYARKRYQNLSEEKDKIRRCRRERHKNISKDEK